MNVSVFIQTLNEEDNLPRCLESLKWSDDIVILDSYSSDRTLDIARAAGARIYQREYDGRANNQNWAVKNIEFKHPWVYYLDADEIVPPELAEEITEVTRDQNRPEVAYRLRFKNMFFGKWLKHGGMYNTWVARLWKPDRIKWERGSNPVEIVDGQVGYLRNSFIHYNFSKGLSGWFHKHNKYSDYEAIETIKELEHGTLDWPGLVCKDYRRRRTALKHLSFRIPCRPVCKFLYMYFLRLGFLDGRAGLTYAALSSVYEYMICIKVRELRRRENNLPI